MTHKECNRILDGLVIDEYNELTLDENLREHLAECPQCREIYQRIEAAKSEKVPDYVPAVLRRIRRMEEGTSSVSWLERLKTAFFRRSVLLYAMAAVAVLIIAIGFGYRLMPEKNDVSYYTTIINVTQADIARIESRERKKEAKVSELVRKNIRSALFDAEESGSG